MLGVHFDWNAERRFEAAATSDADFYSVLNVYRQLKMLHIQDEWDPQSMVVSQLMPPNVCTLIGIRTLLLEERNVLAMSLNERQETPNYLKGVIAKADQAFDAPKRGMPRIIYQRFNDFFFIIYNNHNNTQHSIRRTSFR